MTRIVEITDELPPLPQRPPEPVAGPVSVEPRSLEDKAEHEAIALRSAIAPVMIRAERYACTSPADYEDAAAILAELARLEFAIDDRLGHLIEAANRTHKGLTQLRAQMKAPILERARAVKDRAALWRDAENRRAADEAARLAATQQREDRARAEDTARALDEAGEVDAAAQKREEARTLPAPVVPVVSSVPKATGLGLIGTFEYGFEIVKREDIPAEYWIVDESAILAVVKRQKEACTIPGIRVTKTPATRYRKTARK